MRLGLLQQTSTHQMVLVSEAQLLNPLWYQQKEKPCSLLFALHINILSQSKQECKVGQQLHVAKGLMQNYNTLMKQILKKCNEPSKSGNSLRPKSLEAFGSKMLQLADFSKIWVSGKLQVYHKGQEPGAAKLNAQAFRQSRHNSNRKKGNWEWDFNMLSS